MKSFKQFRNESISMARLDEGNILRQGSVLLLARNAKLHGNNAEAHFKKAKQKFTVSKTSKTLERDSLLFEGLRHCCEGMIALRNQTGALTGIVTASTLISNKIVKK